MLTPLNTPIITPVGGGANLKKKSPDTEERIDNEFETDSEAEGDE